MASAAGDPFAGRRWGEWIVVRRLAVGGMAEIFEVRPAEPTEGRPARAALKVALPQHAEDPEFRKMLAAEARLQGALSHPNLIRVLGHGLADDRPFLALELIDGPSLAELQRGLLRAGRRFPPGVALLVGGELLAALDYVHRACDADGRPLGILHRDVNPPNVLLDREGRVRLGDFGIARSASRETRTHTGVIKGKLRYLAPEQVTGSRLDARTDVYAAGLVLWELLAGEPFLRGETEVELMRGAESPAWRPLADRPGLDARFDPLLERALRRFPEERWGSARACLDALEKLRAEPGLAAGPADLAKLIAQWSALPPVPASSSGAALAEADGAAGVARPATRPLGVPAASKDLDRPRLSGRALAALLALVVLAAAGAWWFLGRTPNASSEKATVPEASMAVRDAVPLTVAADAGLPIAPFDAAADVPISSIEEVVADDRPDVSAVEDDAWIEPEDRPTPAEVAVALAVDAGGQRDARHVATEVSVDDGARGSADGAESVSPVDAASSVPDAAFAPEAAVVVDVGPLRLRLEAVRRDLRAGGILAEDLPAELRADLRAAETALAEGRATDAEALVESVETAAGAVRVDATFVRAKLDRTHAALREAGAQGRDVSALEDLAASALQDFLEGRTDATNRTLNEILRRLASGASGVAVP